MLKYVVTLLCFLSFDVQRKPPSAENSFLGTWHGTSVCVDRTTDTACKDEEVVYVVKAIPSVRDTVEMEAFKIINGERVSMGTLNPAYSQASRQWTFELGARVRAVWAFQVKDSTLTGTLSELPSKRLIRRAYASRVNE